MLFLGVELECIDSAESDKYIKVNDILREPVTKKWKRLPFNFII